MASIDERSYWDRKEARMAAEAAFAAEFAQSTVGQMQALERRLNAMYADRAAYTDEQIAQVQAQLDALKAEQDAAFATEWTPEVTAQRRAAWNALVKSGKLSKGGKINMVAVRQAERAQGWTMDALKRAIKLNNL